MNRIQIVGRPASLGWIFISRLGRPCVEGEERRGQVTSQTRVWSHLMTGDDAMLLAHVYNFVARWMKNWVEATSSDVNCWHSPTVKHINRCRKRRCARGKIGIHVRKQNEGRLEEETWWIEWAYRDSTKMGSRPFVGQLDRAGYELVKINQEYRYLKNGARTLGIVNERQRKHPPTRGRARLKCSDWCTAAY